MSGVGRSRIVGEQCLQWLEESLGTGAPLWRSARIDRPRNLATKSPYEGLNRFVLTLAGAKYGFGAGWFVSQGLCRERNATVREHAPEVMVAVGHNSASGPRSTLRSLVNVADVDGFTAPRGETVKALPILDSLIRYSRAKVGHSAIVATAHYAYATDEIRMPPRSHYESVEDYAGALAHELVHWTGREGREGRFDPERGFEDRVLEELRAEIATVYLCQELGIGPSKTHGRDHDRYVGLWRDLVTQEPMKVLECVVHAEWISEYLLGLEPQLAKRRNRRLAGVIAKREKYPLPPVVMSKAAARTATGGRVIRPRRNFVEYIGEVVGSDAPYLFQRLAGGDVVVHRIQSKGLEGKVSVRYEDGESSVLREVRPLERAATRQTVETLRQGAPGQLIGGLWEAAKLRFHQYVGPIAYVEGRHAIQVAGEGRVIVHDVERIGSFIRRSASVRVRYIDGVGQLKEPGVSGVRELNRDSLEEAS